MVQNRQALDSPFKGHKFDRDQVEHHGHINRSMSVDTEHYMEHLHRKGLNYDYLRSMKAGNDNAMSLASLYQDGTGPGSSVSMSKLQRRMAVLEYLENAKSSNAFRTLKLKGLLGGLGNGGDPVGNLSRK